MTASAFRILFALPVVASLMAACGTGGKPARPPMGTVVGTVTDAKDKKPVAGATVKLGDQTDVTTSEGKFQVSAVTGEFVLSASKEGYKDFLSPSKVTLKEDTITNYDVLLEPLKVVPPRVRISESPFSVTRKREVKFAWALEEMKEAPEQVKYAFMLEGLETSFSPFIDKTEMIFRNLKDGKYVFRIKAREEADRTEGPEATREFEVDGTPPLNPSMVPDEEEKFTGSRTLELVLSCEGAAEVALWEEKAPSPLPWSAFRERRQIILSKDDGEKTVFARFRDDAGNESDTVSFSIVLDREPPSKPGGLRAEVTASNEVRLSWLAAVDAGSGVDSYILLRDGMEIGKTQATTYLDKRADLGKEFAYSVAALDRRGQRSDPSPQIVVALKGNPPNAPTMPNPAQNASSQPTGLTLTWKGGDPDRGDTVVYDLYFGDNANPALRASGLASPMFVLVGLKPSTVYHWRVEAKDSQGLVTKGELWIFTTAEKANTAPAAALSVSPSEGFATTRFRMDASASRDAESPPSELRFRWDLDGDGKPETDWGTDVVLVRTFTERGERDVVVEVRDAAGSVSKASARIEVKNSAPVLDGEPFPQNGSMSEPVELRFTWTCKDADAGDALVYDLYMGTSKQTMRLVGKDLKEGAFVPGEALKRGTLYYWRVEARDGRGGVAKGPLWSFTTAKDPEKTPFRAEVAFQPKTGRTTTPFRFDASASFDPNDSHENLRVRWDWDGDGKAETAWSREKTAVKTFTKVGPNTVILEVQNSKGEVVKTEAKLVIENTPPSFVGHPSPSNGANLIEGTMKLSWDISDPDPEDLVLFDVWFSPANQKLGRIASGQKENWLRATKSLTPGAYNWRVTAKDKHGGKAESPIWTFRVKEKENRPPTKPRPIEGPDQMRMGKEIAVKTSSRDPEGGRVRIRFDWGDGSVSPFTAAGADGSLEQSHLYARQGKYSIKAMAVDPKNSESPWSDPHPIDILPPVQMGEEEGLWFWDPELTKKLPDLFTFKLRYWFANINGTGEWKGVGVPDAELGFRSTLDITERRGAPWLHAEIGKFISGGVEYFQLEYQGSATLGAPAEFADIPGPIPAGTDVGSFCAVRFGHVFFSFNPYLGPYFGGPFAGGGLKLGVGYFWNRMLLMPTGLPSDEETVEFPVPIVGIRLWAILTKYLKIHAEFSYIEGSLQEVNLRTGRLLEASADLLFTPVYYVGISLGFRFTSIHARIDNGTGVNDTDLNMQLDGAVLSIITHF